jgi:hypothetical protein
VTDPEKRVEEIEAKAAESGLLGNLSMDEEVRIYNRRLAVELKEYARRLRSQAEATKGRALGTHQYSMAHIRRWKRLGIS